MSLSRLQEEDNRRSCWVCFATDEDDYNALWVKPCRCRGTTMWVHQSCVQRWIDEKQKGNSSTKVSCPQCNTEYIIVYPKLGRLMHLIDIYDRFIYKCCPFLAAGIGVGGTYWCLVTYGAITVMQVMGHKEGMADLNDDSDPIFLLIVLPLIPISLILGKMVRWEDFILKLLRKHTSKLPILKYFFPNGLIRIPAETQPLSDPISATRVLCGALILPTVATMAGKVMFSNVSSNFQRTLLGGVAFVAIKGLLKIFYKQQQYLQQASRVIKDHDTQVTPPPQPAGVGNNDTDNNTAAAR